MALSSRSEPYTHRVIKENSNDIWLIRTRIKTLFQARIATVLKPDLRFFRNKLIWSSCWFKILRLFQNYLNFIYFCLEFSKLAFILWPNYLNNTKITLIATGYITPENCILEMQKQSETKRNMSIQLPKAYSKKRKQVLVLFSQDFFKPNLKGHFQFNMIMLNDKDIFWMCECIWR